MKLTLFTASIIFALLSLAGDNTTAKAIILVCGWFSLACSVLIHASEEKENHRG